MERARERSIYYVYIGAVARFSHDFVNCIPIKNSEKGYYQTLQFEAMNPTTESM